MKNDDLNSEINKGNGVIDKNNNEEKSGAKLGENSNKKSKKTMKKSLIVSSILGLATAAGIAGGVIATNNGADLEKNPPNNYVNFLDFTKGDNGVYSAEVANAIENLDFSKCIEVSENCTWQLFKDAEATEPIEDMLIALVQGYNTFYVKVFDEYGDFKIYALQVRRQNQIHTVTFYAFDGVSISVQSVEEGTLVTKPQDPVKDGYEFMGWNFDFNTPITEDTVITANCNLINYNISYDLNGGENNVNNPDTYTINNNITLLNASKNGYEFKGWYSDSEFKTQVNEITKGSMGEITLYAKYEIVNYDITYDLNDGIDNTNNPATYTVETETITLQEPTKEGYIFEGWWRDNNEQVTEITKGTYGNINLSARWKQNSYTITFNSMGGSDISSQTVKYNNLIEVPTRPTKNGYTFNAWYTEESYTNEWNFLTVVTSDMVLYAKYDLDEYDIIYHLYDGTNNTENPESYTIETETITLKEPTREGYTFDGWYTDELFSEEITEIPNGNSGNVSLYAKWTKVGGGSEVLENEAFYYTSDGMITGLKDTSLTVVRVPSEIDGVKITAIADHAFENNTEIIKVVLDEGIETIGSYAFSGCSNLSGINCKSIETIGAYAFSGCSAMTRIIFTNVAKVIFESEVKESVYEIPYSNYSSDDAWQKIIVKAFTDYYVEAEVRVIYL
ncbi:MAG: InlB B-repeat-containing protein [Bacilli bacterium]|nr:InlB B-repeat-containing protein [Bacilli bacterium]